MAKGAGGVIAFRCELVASACGPAEIAALDSARIAAIAKHDFGAACTTARDWCERWAAQLGGAPQIVNVEVWDISAGGKLRYTLYYTPWSDSGTVFRAGSADIAELELWPDGFRPAGAEAEALTKAFQAAVAAKLAPAKSKKTKKTKKTRT